MTTRVGYETVEIGNAEVPDQLRRLFDLSRLSGVDLATTIVPVVALELGGELGEEARVAWAHSRVEPAPGVGIHNVIGVRNVGTGDAIVRVTHLNAFAGSTRPRAFVSASGMTGVNQVTTARALRSHTALRSVVGLQGTATQADICATLGIASDALAMADNTLALVNQNSIGYMLLHGLEIELLPGGSLYVFTEAAQNELNVSILGDE